MLLRCCSGVVRVWELVFITLTNRGKFSEISPLVIVDLYNNNGQIICFVSHYRFVC